MIINPKDYSAYVVTGVLTDGRRFRKTFSSEHLLWVFGTNLWRGSVWGIKRKDARRKLLKRVKN